MMKLKKNILIITLKISFVIMAFASIYFLFFRKRDGYEKLNLNGVDNLMFVAHPDDEMLWGGRELIKNNYLVVCITCGSNKVRVKEFKKVMKETKDKYYMLGYPDKIMNMRSNWKKEYPRIKEDVEKIYKLKNWKKVVVHNPYGEYGHMHHKMTSKIVSEVVDHNKLYYFNMYKRKSIIDYHNPMPKEDLEEKKRILSIYKSQGFIKKMFYHMIAFEKLIPYEDWMNNEEFKQKR